jgi:hypothetical protein
MPLMGLLIAGGVTLAAGIGLPIMGYFVARSGDSEAFYPLVGVGILTSLIGIALLILSALVRGRRTEEEPHRSVRLTGACLLDTTDGAVPGLPGRVGRIPGRWRCCSRPSPRGWPLTDPEIIEVYRGVW